MKIKQISITLIFPALLFSVFFAGFANVSPVSAAAKTCIVLYGVAPVASQAAKDKAAELLAACEKGVDTGKCNNIQAGANTTKREKTAACEKGVAYRAENPPDDGGGGSLGPTGDDCGGVETAIIKCDADNSGGVETNGIWALLLLVINIMTAGVGILAIAGIVYGAVLYTTAEDKADQVKKATDIITNVVIGLVAFALMWAGLNFIIPGGVFA